jgi:hypothetical protein
MTPGLRKLANVGLGGSFVATIILFGIWLFRVLQGAEAASDVLTVVRGIDINWPIVWLFVICVLAFGIVANNWDVIANARRQRARDRKRTWDMPVCDAVIYIATRSMWSADFRRTIDARSEASKALVEAAQLGRIQACGRPTQRSLQSPIPRKVWRQYTLSIGGCEDDGVGAMLIRRGNNSHAFIQLVVDKHQIESVWPRNRQRDSSWTG